MYERCRPGSVGLLLALRGAQRHGEAEQHESKDTDRKANKQHGRYCIRKNDCRKPRKLLNEAMCVEQKLQDAAEAQPPVQQRAEP
jgi:hypothetical protein